MKLNKIFLIALVVCAFLVPVVASAQSSSVWKYVSGLLQPVVATWNVYSPADFRFDGDLLPDGADCSAGEILKKTGANDWDCAADQSGGGSDFATSSSDYWLTTKDTDDLAEGSTNKYFSATLARQALSAVFPIVYNQSTGQFSFGGLGTSTALTKGNLVYVTGSNTVSDVATTTVTCAGSASCTGFVAIGNSPITITASGGSGGVGTTTPWTADDIVIVSDNDTLTSTSSINLAEHTNGILPATRGGLGVDFSGAASGLMTWVNALAQPVITSTFSGLGSVLSGVLPIEDGGTNASGFTSSNPLAFDGTRVSGTSTPTASYFIATSTDNASVLPYASTTAISSQTASTTNGIVSRALRVDGCLSAGYNGSGSCGTASIQARASNASGLQGNRVEGDAASAIGLSSYVTGDAQVRFSFLVDGLMKWSSGALAPDVQLGRNSAGNLTLSALNAGMPSLSIGTTTPGALLGGSTTDRVGILIDQRGTDDILRLLDAGTNVFNVKDGGNVGVGTSSPQATLAVAGGNILLENNRYLSAYRNGSTAVSILGINGSSQTQLDSGGGNNIIFRPGGSTLMTLTPGALVGIGTTTPDYLLTIGDGGGSANNKIAIDAAAARQSSISFRSAGVDRWFVGRGDSDVLPVTTFFIGNGTGNANDPGGSSAKFVIDSTGNVGLGTTTPGAKLAVDGSGLFNGLITAQRYIATSTNNALNSVFPFASSTTYSIHPGSGQSGLLVRTTSGTPGNLIDVEDQFGTDLFVQTVTATQFNTLNTFNAGNTLNLLGGYLSTSNSVTTLQSPLTTRSAASFATPYNSTVPTVRFDKNVSDDANTLYTAGSIKADWDVSAAATRRGEVEFIVSDFDWDRTFLRVTSTGTGFVTYIGRGIDGSSTGGAASSTSISVGADTNSGSGAGVGGAGANVDISNGGINNRATGNGGAAGNVTLAQGGNGPDAYGNDGTVTIGDNSGLGKNNAGLKVNGNATTTGTVYWTGLQLNTGAATASLCLDSNNQMKRNTDAETCIASSERYKQNIEKLSDLTDELMSLETVSFRYKENNKLTHYGLIAEQVEDIDPLLVSYDDDGLPNGIRWSHIVALLVQGHQDQEARINALENKQGVGYWPLLGLLGLLALIKPKK